MDFDELAALYLEAAPDEQQRVPPLPDIPARRLRDALEPVATQSWWSRGVHERLDGSGLDFFESYVWGRAAGLGEPSAAVVVATFGVFEPGMIGPIYDSGRRKLAREDVLAARAAGAAAGLAALLSAEEAGALGDVLLAATATLDATARPLFAGLRGLPVPTDPHGRLWRGAELVREHRGDGHLAACVAAGLDPVSMNVLTELFTGYALGEYSSTRGYDAAAIARAADELGARGWVADGRLTEAGAAARRAIEDATDRTQAGLIANLGDRVEAVIAQAEAVATKILAARVTPADPRKQAAG
jgi:hypothetical protein